MRSIELSEHDCQTCLYGANAEFCLDPTDFTKGTCCDPLLADEDQPAECKSSLICGTTGSLTN